MKNERLSPRDPRSVPQHESSDGVKRFLQCLSCGEILPAAPLSDSQDCRCRNISIETDRASQSFRDRSKYRVLFVEELDAILGPVRSK